MEMSFAAAQRIAEREAQQRFTASLIFSRYQSTPLTMQIKTEGLWVFTASSEALFEDDVTPDALYVWADKTDVHLWSRIEQEAFYTQRVLPNGERKFATQLT